ATMLDLNREAFQIVGIDLSDYGTFRGAVLDLDGEILVREERDRAGATGAAAVDLVVALTEELIVQSTLPLLGIGVGSPGIVDLGGVVLSAPNLDWVDVQLQRILADRFGIPA